MLEKTLGYSRLLVVELATLIFICTVVAYVSPVRLSPDSAIYLHAAATKVDLYHPHHLLFASALRAMVRLQESVGLGGGVVFTYRRAMLLLSSIALAGVWIFLVSQKLSVSQRIFGLLAIGLTSTWVQYSTLIESAVPAVGTLCLAAALFQKVISAGAENHSAPRSLLTGPFISTCIAFVISYVIAVCFHQTAVLAAVPFLVLAVSSYYGLGLRQKLLLPALLLAVSGGLGALLYVSAHRSVANDLPFGVWVTKYAHYQGQGWGPSANVSWQGLVRLLRSLGLMVHNPQPSEFYGGGAFQARSILLGAGILALAVATGLTFLRDKSRRGENGWLVAWFLVFEGFIFAWSHRPYYHLLAFPPLVVLSCRFAEILPARAKQVGTYVLAGTTLLLGTANVLTMRQARLKDSSAVGVEIEAMWPWIREGDVVVAAWHERLFLEAMGIKAAYYRVSEAAGVVPRWAQGDVRRLILAKSVAVLAGNPPAEAEKHFRASVQPLLNQLIAKPQGGMRGAVITIPSSGQSVGIAFGVDKGLPLSIEQALGQFAQSLAADPHIAKGVVQGWLEAGKSQDAELKN